MWFYLLSGAGTALVSALRQKDQSVEELNEGTPSALHKFRQPIAMLSGRHLFPRASPLKKSPTGAFFNSPPARGIVCLSVSRSAERDEGAALDLQAFEKA